ncbi:hypothetical protein IU433_20580 [Nocardia puris]|nr:hypothetical protein [Nocardia puris]MBF6212836.1 hypothetical protein [Nocardia puris]MBF6461422.1 hypothetical protein [Nocardia puris]
MIDSETSHPRHRAPRAAGLALSARRADRVAALQFVANPGAVSRDPG